MDDHASVDSFVRSNNIDHYVDRLAMADVDFPTRQMLLKLLVEEEDKVAKTRRELINAKRRVERGKARILALSQAIMPRTCRERPSLRSLASLATLYGTQMLLERHYRRLREELGEGDFLT